MRGNTTIIFDLPLDVDKLYAGIDQVVPAPATSKIWNAAFHEADQRDGTPKQISLTIGWELSE